MKGSLVAWVAAGFLATPPISSRRTKRKILFTTISHLTTVRVGFADQASMAGK